MAAQLSSTGISHHNPSPCSQQQPSHWDCSIIPKLQLPDAAPSRRPVSVSVMFGYGKDCLILIPFRLPLISCFSLKYFSSDSDNRPSVGIGPLLQLPHPPRAGPVLLTLLFFLLALSSYRVLHDSTYSFVPVRYSCQLSVFCMHFVSEGVFLMYPWREMYSTPTYSSTILFFSEVSFLLIPNKNSPTTEFLSAPWYISIKTNATKW